MDIEESKNLASQYPEKVKFMSKALIQKLKEMDADYPHKNPYSHHYKSQAGGTPKILKSQQSGNIVSLKFQSRGNSINHAYLMYTLNGGQESEEWYRLDAQVEGNEVSADLPKGATHYIFNLIDSEDFLISHPKMGQVGDFKRRHYSIKAISVN